MSYLILARKYRPQKFSDLTGQETTSKILQSAILSGRVAPAYLFSGTRGTGKTTSARIFAKALNCHKRNPKTAGAAGDAVLDPCDDCPSCREITQGHSLDVLEIDAASHTGVDNMREVVINTVVFAPVRDAYKVFVIDEVHMLSASTFNALLKTLEEPPAHVVFILCTTEFHKIPATISSRCQRFRFLPLTQKQILSNLQKVASMEAIAIAEDALALIAMSAGGSMRDALSLFDQVISNRGPSADGSNSGAIDLKRVEETLGSVRDDLLLGFIEKVAARDSRGVLECVGQTLQEGYDLSFFLKELRELFREMLAEKCGFSDEESLHLLRPKLPTQSFSVHQLLRASQILTRCAEQMRWTDLPRLVFECYAVWLCQDSVSANDILERLESGGAEISKPRPASAPTAPVFEPRQGSAVSPAVAKAEQAHGQDAEPDVADTAAGAEQAHADLRVLWRQVVVAAQQLRPSMTRALETAVVETSGDRIDLGFSSSLWLDNVKKNSGLLEEMICKSAQRRITLTFRQLDPGQTRSPTASVPDSGKFLGEQPPLEEAPLEESQDEDGARVSPLFEEDDNPGAGAELDPAQIEDKQLKGFAQLFPGKLTKKQGRHP